MASFKLLSLLLLQLVCMGSPSPFTRVEHVLDAGEYHKQVYCTVFSYVLVLALFSGIMFEVLDSLVMITAKSQVTVTDKKSFIHTKKLLKYLDNPF